MSVLPWSPGQSDENLPFFNAGDWGAIGDGVTNDRTALQNAIDAASDAGGGAVLIPPGTFLVGSAVNYKSNVHVKGSGRGATVIELDDSADDHVFNTTAIVTDASISSLTIDANRAGQTSTIRAHGIRSANDLTRVTFQDLHIQNSSGYGIGLQGATGVGTFEDLTIQDVFIESSGTDGIDIKNREDTNIGLKIHNVYIKGIDKQADDGKSGIDLRGHGVMSNIFVDMEAPATGTGITFTAGTGADASGEGGRHSALTNFYVVGGNVSTEQNVGVTIANPFCRVSNGYIESTYRGIRVTSDRCIIQGVNMQDIGDNGIRIESTADQTVIGMCHLYDFNDYGIYIAGDNTTVTGNVVVDNNTVGNIEVASGAQNTKLIHNSLTGSGTELLDNGTNTLFARYGFNGSPTAADTPGNFSANRYIPITDAEGNTVYVAASTTTW